MFNSLNAVPYDTEELKYVLDVTNPMMNLVYKIAYSVSRENNGDFVDNLVRDMIAIDDTLDATFKSLHANTIFTESIRRILNNKGIELMNNPILVDVLNIYTVVNNIEDSDVLASGLSELNPDDSDIFVLANKLGFEIDSFVEYIGDTSKFVSKLYANNKEDILEILKEVYDE